MGIEVQVGDPSGSPSAVPLVPVSEFRLSGRRVPVVRCRRLLRGTFGQRPRDGRSQSTCIFYLERACGPVVGCARRRAERPVDRSAIGAEVRARVFHIAF